MTLFLRTDWLVCIVRDFSIVSIDTLENLGKTDVAYRSIRDTLEQAFCSSSTIRCTMRIVRTFMKTHGYFLSAYRSIPYRSVPCVLALRLGFKKSEPPEIPEKSGSSGNLAISQLLKVVET